MFAMRETSGRFQAFPCLQMDRQNWKAGGDFQEISFTLKISNFSQDEQK